MLSTLEASSRMTADALDASAPSPPMKGQVASLMVSVPPFVLTLAMPLSRDDSLAYIWLVPMTC